MQIVRSFIAAFTVITVLTGLVAASVAGANNATNVSHGLTAKGYGLAVHGYDVVAYFTKGRPTIGRAKFSAVHNEATYRFASEDHLKTFTDNPEKYLPQYGGYCAYGVAVGAKFDGDPHQWRIVAGKLYLNLNPEVQKLWRSDIPGFIKKADRNWSKIATKTPDDLS